jgi:hypothetical protein
VTEAQRAAVDRKLGHILSDGVARTEEAIVHRFLVDYRAALKSLLPELLKQSGRFESLSRGYWRLKAARRPSNPKGDKRLTKVRLVSKKKKTKNKKELKPARAPANSLMVVPKKRKRRGGSASERGVSVWTVSGGLPSLGKRR